MSPPRTSLSVLLAPALALAACGPAKTPEAAPGAVENYTDMIDRNAAAVRKEAIRDADARSETRAEDAVDRIRESEKKRLAGD